MSFYMTRIGWHPIYSRYMWLALLGQLQICFLGGGVSRKMGRFTGEHEQIVGMKFFFKFENFEKIEKLRNFEKIEKFKNFEKIKKFSKKKFFAQKKIFFFGPIKKIFGLKPSPTQG